MIKLLDDTYQVVTITNTEEQLFCFLKEILKNLDDQARQNWQFSKHSHKLFAPFVKEIQEKPFVDMVWQACQRELDIIVMCKGDSKKPSLFLATPDLDVDALLNEWSQLFCKAHKMTIMRQ